MNVGKRSIVITGGTKGIGFAIAESLAATGARVFICGRSQTDIDASVARLSMVGEAAGSVCDVRDEEQVRRMLDDAKKGFGGVDILINNAGMGIFGKTVEELSGDEFRQTVETNLFGVFYCCHYAIPMMKERGGGYIFNISSLAGQNAHPRMA
ncbi:MAG: SDR family NAD(P)-dependent oxidoreductase, partial [Pyrinomonadaceae bacterium]